MNNPRFNKYKPLLLFAFRGCLLYIAFLFVKFLHREMVESSSTLAIGIYIREFDIYTRFANSIVWMSEFILNALGYDTTTSDRVLSISGCRGVIINGPCMGFNIFSAFIALIVAYPAEVSWFKKVLFIISGLLLIHLLNVIRITALVIKNQYSYELPINHHDLYNLIIYAFVFILFYIWLKYTSKAQKTPFNRSME